MAKQDYVDPSDAGFTAQLLTFKNAIPAYATVLGLTPAQVAAQAADADYSEYVLNCDTVLGNASSQLTKWKKITREGGNLPPTGAPVAPVLPAAVPAVAPGIEPRFRGLVRQIKANPAYNAAIGQALGIEGSESADPDLDLLAPVLTVTLAGGQVQVGWGWQGLGSKLDLIEIQVDRGAGYGLLTYDTTPGYTDTTPLPATPQKWTYKAIFRVGDSPVGQWSPETALIVGG